jgi:hypothetical protein
MQEIVGRTTPMVPEGLLSGNGQYSSGRRKVVALRSASVIIGRESYPGGSSGIQSIHLLVQIRASHRFQIAHRARQILVSAAKAEPMPWISVIWL